METSCRMIEVAIGSVANRGNVIPLYELHDYVRNKTELYRSMSIVEKVSYRPATSTKILSLARNWRIYCAHFDIIKEQQ